MLERDIEKYLVTRVKLVGGEVRKVKWIGRRGAPDRLVMLPASELCSEATIWVELKAPGLSAKAYQSREHDRMRGMGQRVVVIASIAGVDNLMRGRE